MSVSRILEIPQITEAQANKATAFNEGMSMMERALADRFALNTSSVINLATSTLALPYDGTDDLGNRDALRFIYLDILAGASRFFTVQLPDNPHLFFCKNNTPHSVTIKTATGAGAVILANTSQIIYCDGEDTTALLAGGGTVVNAADLQLSYFGRPAADEVLLSYTSARDITFPADLTGTVGYVTENPAAAYTVRLVARSVATMQRVNFATLTVSTAGTYLMATIDNEPYTVPAGRVIMLEAPDYQDATLLDLQFAIPATVVVPQ